MLSLLSISLYSLTWAYMLRSHLQQKPYLEKLILVSVAIAMFFHGAAVYFSVVTEHGFQLGIFKIASLFCFVFTLLVLLSSIKKPLHSLFIFPKNTLKTP